MATDVDIANMALGHLGTRATISDLNENSVEAREIQRVYAITRDNILSMLDWNFARVFLSLATGTATLPARWGFCYAYPSDCLKFWRIDLGLPTAFAIGQNPSYEVGSDGTNRFIYCNIDQAIGVYTQRVTDPNRFEPEFTSAFAMTLAALTALPIMQRVDLKNSCSAEAFAMIERAMATSANEQRNHDGERPAESIAVRGYTTDRSWPWNVIW